MKHKQLFILITNIIIGVFYSKLWAAPDLFQNYSQYFFYEDRKIITGVNGELSMFQGRFSTDFSLYNFGLSLFSERYFQKFPCVLHGGNLLIGGIISRLKDPALDSDCSGYTSCFSEPSPITSELPSYSSFSKPLSTFLQLSYADDKLSLKEIILNGSYTPSTHKVNFSILSSFNIMDKISLCGTSGISIFNIEENKPNTWYSSIPSYEKRQSFSICNQIGITILDSIKCNLSVFIYDSAVKKFGTAYKLENQWKTKNLSLGLACFYNPNYYLITPENNILKPVVQLKTNLQYNFIPSLKSGITIYTKVPLTPSISSDIKLGLSTTLSTEITTLQGDVNFTYKGIDQFVLTYCSTKLQSTWNFEFICPTLKLSSRLYFSSVPKSQAFIPIPKLNTNSHYISLEINLLNQLIKGNSTFSFSCKNHNIYNKKLKFGLSFNSSFKKIIVTMKINGDFCI